MRKPSGRRSILPATRNRVAIVMKQIVPLVLALIPLAAVVGACVTCP
jgi:hypothetical protein